MTITPRPDQERQIAEAMETGAYQNPQDVIERALEMLRAEAEWVQEHKDGISAKIERAFGQFERGEFLSAEQSREEMNRRKAAWLVNSLA